MFSDKFLEGIAAGYIAYRGITKVAVRGVKTCFAGRRPLSRTL